MILNKFLSIFIFAALLALPSIAYSQVAPTGRTMEASSQLIFWYDNDVTSGIDRQTQIQLTNTSATSPIEVHIQIYASTGDAVDVANTVRCVEADFNDTLTANDTVVYNLFGPILLNDGSPAPVADVDDSKGFVVITPVVGSGDNTAIAFQHLIGTTYVDDVTLQDTLRVNAMGRDAVNFATGQVLPDTTALDGIGTGFVQLQPSELNFNAASAPGASNADIAAIVFADEYGPAGLLGYRAVPAESSWSPFLFDFQEIPGSCPIATNACFNNWGLSAQIPARNQLIDPAINICNAVVLPADAQGATTSWTRAFISGLDPLESQIAIVNFTDTAIVPAAGADWANAN